MMTTSGTPAVALAHDSFTQWGGAERVVEAMHEIYPDAPLYTLAVDRQFRARLAGWPIVSSWLQGLYDRLGHFQWLFPLAPQAVASLQVPPTIKTLVSSSSSYLKGIALPPTTVHINYCHTPTRFVWSDRAYALRELPAVLRPFAAVYLHWLARWDLRAAGRVTHFIANSREVQDRIKKYYRRDSQIIYPFIDLEFWKPTGAKGSYFLVAGRLQPYKANDIVIRAFNLLGLELHVAGTGRHEGYLRSIAGPTIKFLGRVSDEQLREEYSGALAYIFPQHEDFGLMPLEAAACGTATLALGSGGARETIVPGQTGEFFSRQTPEAVMAAVTAWQAGSYSRENLRRHAAQFSKERFLKELAAFVHEHSR